MHIVVKWCWLLCSTLWWRDDASCPFSQPSWHPGSKQPAFFCLWWVVQGSAWIANRPEDKSLGEIRLSAHPTTMHLKRQCLVRGSSLPHPVPPGTDTEVMHSLPALSRDIINAIILLENAIIPLRELQFSRDITSILLWDSHLFVFNQRVFETTHWHCSDLPMTDLHYVCISGCKEYVHLTYKL